ncbi:hypothetical protein FDI29_gp01 [Arthrobacter phage Abidatro]|uniref:Uncharacterized protein n=1 Tax=Arthrobacter phage Abidatro TaxID=2015853 RepID=A0A222ZG58_9CAUD|nr:hypothetical protein FDI29_gp01 [Arthrobacter phage Abidatro]ASR83171.1 hypothetical protein SEA_ABIDATRO_1 [Arthrobacter phage Abidatro]
MHDEHKLTAVRAAAAYGERVAIFAETLPAAQGLLPEFEALGIMADVVARFRRVNGSHSIAFDRSGGSIEFRSLNSRGSRGASFDRVYVPVCSAPDKVAGVLPCLNVSGGPLVGY